MRGKASSSPAESREITQLILLSPSPALARTNLGRLIESGGSGALKKLPALDLPALIRMLGGSAYLSDILIREGKDWPQLFLRQMARSKKRVEDHLEELSPLFNAETAVEEFRRGLRRYKQREFLRIGVKDLLSAYTVEETVAELTALAEACLEAAYRFCRREVEREFGLLLLPGKEEENRFVILGMGKLGGEELNFSSDIDLIFLFEEEEGVSRGGTKGVAAPSRFFTRLGETIIRTLGEVTEQGFVFRTDMRLRPLGRDGPLVQSSASALLYYESWGQCWERAALIKARPVAGNRDLGAGFLRGVEPFLYRRYLDFTTIEELRHLKTRIERELLGQESKGRNVKLGWGGIREIEFFTQALQLLNCGYDRRVRHHNTLRSLGLLARYGYIPSREKERLSSAYRFLRDVEHKIQMLHGEQTHSIPAGDEEENALARRMGYAEKKQRTERDLFWEAYRRHTTRVREAFDRLFFAAQNEISQEKTPGPTDIWKDLDREGPVLEELKKLGFSDPEKAYRNILSVRDGEPYSPPSQRRIQVMRLLGPALMAEVVRSLSPDRALFNLAEFTHRVGARTGFLSLLAENPKTMRLLVNLFASSQFLTDLFLKRPELLDSLIRVDLVRPRKARAEILREFVAAIADADGLEAKLNSIRRHGAEEFLRIGLHDTGQATPLEEVIAQLSDLAEACLEVTLMLAIDALEPHYGRMPKGRFAVFGMGKLGGKEIDYGSDLDLIFIYEAPEDAQTGGGASGHLRAHEYYVKLGQKLIAFLSAPTEEGRLYEVDMRLRPSGRFGPLVTSVSAYRVYHETSSELWERQALIKMRFVAGDRNLGARVEAMAEGFVYSRGLAPEDVAKINHLRMRMEKELAGESESQFNLKKGKGGIVDVEFITQMLQLSHGQHCPEIRRRGTLEALEALSLHKIISRREYRLLREGYVFLRQLDHRLRLERARSIDVLEWGGEKLEEIARAPLFGSDHAVGKKNGGRRLLRNYERQRDRIRSCYGRFFPTAE